jgi:transposase
MTKPAYITIKDLNILGMMKNKRLSSDRVYICQERGLKIDRDLNAAMNL